MANEIINQPGWYEVECGAYKYTLPERYQNVIPLGNGAYSTVICATDTVTGKTVAIKKLLRAFDTPVYAQRTYRELKLLMYLNHPDAQIVQLYNVFTPEKNLNEFQTLYFVLSYSDYDLNKVIRRQKPFTEKHIKLIIYSLLRGLKFMHSAGIMHRDLKPQNIGVDKNSNVTILDFGLSRVAKDGDNTTYVATRWWRAPEVAINPKQYGIELDIWAIGCIMAELILLRPLFPGLDSMHQLVTIFGVLGTPDISILRELCTPELLTYIIELEEKEPQSFEELFGYKYDINSDVPISGVSSNGVDLLKSLLQFDYRKRPTAATALASPFFEGLHEPADEPTTERMIDEHQDQTYSILMWKSIVWQMIEDFTAPSWVDDDAADDS